MESATARQTGSPCANHLVRECSRDASGESHETNNNNKESSEQVTDGDQPLLSFPDLHAQPVGIANVLLTRLRKRDASNPCQEP